MGTTLDADLELLATTAERHAATMSTRSCVHLSAAVDALTDPLVLPPLSGVDDAATADLAGVLRAVHGRLLHATQHTSDIPRTIAIAFAARELGQALAALGDDPPGPAAGGQPAAPAGDPRPLANDQDDSRARR